MDRAGSDAIGHAMDFDARLAAIEQPASTNAIRREAIDALRRVSVVQMLTAFSATAPAFRTTYLRSE
jgi:hypothetical protein